MTELAALSHMSNAAFHRHFKAATAMSPIQCQKQPRLLEARHMLIAQLGNAAHVAFTAGYESASQFSREHARQFGLPPTRVTPPSFWPRGKWLRWKLTEHEKAGQPAPTSS